MKIKILGSVYDNPKGYNKGRGMIYSIGGIMAALHGLTGGQSPICHNPKGEIK